MRIAGKLKDRIYEVVRKIKTNHAGVAFSGGVDSSLLASVCQDVFDNIYLLTIGFSSDRDIKMSTKLAKELELRIFHEVISMENLEESLNVVIPRIEFDRIAFLENAICFYHVFKLAWKHDIRIVLSANGVDELFCGYYMYKNFFGNKDSIMVLMDELVKIAKKDMNEIMKLSKLFRVEYACPFLSDYFVDFAVGIPLEFKMKSKEDRVRKHIIREIASKVGVPELAALRPKKAFQYSSGLHKAIIKLARKNGFNKRDSKLAGFQGEIEAYLSSLRKSRET